MGPKQSKYSANGGLPNRVVHAYAGGEPTSSSLWADFKRELNELRVKPPSTIVEHPSVTGANERTQESLRRRTALARIAQGVALLMGSTDAWDKSTVPWHHGVRWMFGTESDIIAATAYFGEVVAAIDRGRVVDAPPKFWLGSNLRLQTVLVQRTRALINSIVYGAIELCYDISPAGHVVEYDANSTFTATSHDDYDVGKYVFAPKTHTGDLLHFSVGRVRLPYAYFGVGDNANNVAFAQSVRDAWLAQIELVCASLASSIVASVLHYTSRAHKTHDAYNQGGIAPDAAIAEAKERAASEQCIVTLVSAYDVRERLDNIRISHHHLQTAVADGERVGLLITAAATRLNAPLMSARLSKFDVFVSNDDERSDVVVDVHAGWRLERTGDEDCLMSVVDVSSFTVGHTQSSTGPATATPPASIGDVSPPSEAIVPGHVGVAMLSDEGADAPVDRLAMQSETDYGGFDDV